jgi:K+-transporting ATPase KdpF subunit
VRAARAGHAMNDTLWLGLVTLGVFGYLLYAMLVPEKF